MKHHYAEAFQKLFSKSLRLTSLHFEDIPCVDVHMQTIANALTQNRFITKLGFVNCGLRDETLRILTYAVNASNLEELNLSDNPAGEDIVLGLLVAENRLTALKAVDNECNMIYFNSEVILDALNKKVNLSCFEFPGRSKHKKAKEYLQRNQRLKEENFCLKAHLLLAQPVKKPFLLPELVKLILIFLMRAIEHQNPPCVINDPVAKKWA